MLLCCKLDMWVGFEIVQSRMLTMFLSTGFEARFKCTVWVSRLLIMKRQSCHVNLKYRLVFLCLQTSAL